MPKDDSFRDFTADIFQALAHPTRIAIIESLRDEERSAGELIELLELERVNASQHLAVLRSKQMVVSRKEGNQVFYSLRDPVLSDVLDVMRSYLKTHIAGARASLNKLEKIK
jgi:DNA-binding transcriptional ArsR family regulator